MATLRFPCPTGWRFHFSFRCPPYLRVTKSANATWNDLPLELKLKIIHSIDHDDRSKINKYQLGDVGRTAVLADTILQQQHELGFPAKRLGRIKCISGQGRFMWGESQSQLVGKWLAFIDIHRAKEHEIVLYDIEKHRFHTVHAGGLRILSMVLTDKMVVYGTIRHIQMVLLSDVEKDFQMVRIIPSPIRPPLLNSRPLPNMTGQGKSFAFAANHQVYVWKSQSWSIGWLQMQHFMQFHCPLGPNPHGLLLLDNDVYVVHTENNGAKFHVLVQQYTDGNEVDRWTAPFTPGNDASNDTRTIAVRPTGYKYIWQLILPWYHSLMVDFQNRCVINIPLDNTRAWKGRLYDSKRDSIRFYDERKKLMGSIKSDKFAEDFSHGVYVNEHYLLKYQRVWEPRLSDFSSSWSIYSFDYFEEGKRTKVALMPRRQPKLIAEGPAGKKQKTE